MTALRTTLRDTIRTAAWLPRTDTRGRRVMVLLVGIIVLSLADLVLTLVHLTSTGMLEANPIAAWVIRTTDSSWALAGFKILTTGLPVALLYRLRKHVEGEIAAWCGVAILTVLSVMWSNYTDEFHDPENIRLAQSGMYGDQWLVLE